MSAAAAPRLSGLGVWSGELRFLRDRGAALEAAAELDELGFAAVWVPGGPDDRRPLLDALGEFLAATRRTTLASGILSIWVAEPDTVAAGAGELIAAHPGRLLLGLGVSHGRYVDPARGEEMKRPLTAMRRYLDALDRAGGVGAADRVLAALGPRMLDLARERSAGAHPFLVTPTHTARAREALGPAALLAPEQAVVLETDPGRAREIARAHLSLYLELPNYTDNMRREGFTAADLAGGGSDALVDGLVAWGDEEAIAARVAAHREAGADHVALQVLSGRRGELPLPEWRRLAALG
jgi:probable F420-dependent oxidoreductase